MSKLSNKVQLIGNLGAAVEITNLESGKKVARLSIATNENYKNQQGETVTDTQWHTCVAWNKTAEILEDYTQKGSKIAIEGKLISRSYEDKDEKKKYVAEVLISEVLLLDSKV